MKALLQRSLRSSVVVTVLAGAVAAAEITPSFYREQLQEDGVVEWATFFSFVFAAALAIRTLRQTQGRTLARLALLGIGLFCVFVAGEEISWGQRLFAFKPPEIFLEHNYQQEANVHNFLKDILDTRWIVLFIAFVYGIVFPLVAKKWRGFAPLSPDLSLAPGFLCVAVLEALYPFDLSGELAELFLGLCFLADVAMRAGVGSVNTIVGWQAAAILAGVVGTPLIERALYGDSEVLVAHCRGELELLSADLSKPKKLRRKLLRKGRVHKRLFTAARAQYLAFGTESQFLEGQISAAESELESARRDRQGFFLDPWNQPYWLLFLRAREGPSHLLIYSFGPNRRRDSVLDPLPIGGVDRILSGDDLGVLLDLDRKTGQPITIGL